MKFPRREQSIPGWEARTTPSGVRVIRIEHLADPDKRAPDFLERAKAFYQNESKFRREFLIDWTSSDTGPVYPEFRDLHARELVQLKAPGLVQNKQGEVVVYRGWDFGERFPACTWLQKSESSRWWILREIMPEGLNVFEHRDLVMALSGQIQPDNLPERSAIWWRQVVDGATFGYWPKPPWFQARGAQPIRFVDYAGHESVMANFLVEREPVERTASTVLAEKGIFLNVWGGPRKARETVIRKLWMLRPDGYPSMLVDPACRILTTGFLGGICYPKPTEANPNPDVSRKDGYYEHLHDALGYVLVNQEAIAGEYQAPPREPLMYEGRGALVPREKVEDLGFTPAWENF